MDLDNLGKAKDPFAVEADEPDDAAPAKDLIHIRVQQRNGRKCITTVQGLNQELDMKKIVKAIKKVRAALEEQQQLPCSRSRSRRAPPCAVAVRVLVCCESVSFSLCRFCAAAMRACECAPLNPPRCPPSCRAAQAHSCNGTIVEDDDMGQVMQFSGDQREAIANFLIENELAAKGDIKKHGTG